MSNLAREIVAFMEMWDFYTLLGNNREIEEDMAETEMRLWNDRKGIMDYLKGFAENANDDDCASEAAVLYRRVVAL